VDPHLVEF
jgi:hypothetical protein